MSINDIDEMNQMKSFHQLAILCLDGSGSMGHTSTIDNISFHEVVNKAVREFLSYFKNSSIVDNFSVAIITFDTVAKIHTPPTPLSQINDYGNYDPILEHGGGTNIGEALTLAQDFANQHLNAPDAKKMKHSAVVAVMTDGMCQNPLNTLTVADQLKLNNIQLWCSHFCNKEDYSEPIMVDARNLLEKLVTSPDKYKTSYKADDLRKFFIASQSSI